MTAQTQTDTQTRASAPTTMRAIVRDTYGTPDVLELREIPRPLAGGDEVLIRVHASSVNFGDWAMLTGKPYPIRLFAGLRRPKNPIFGLDVAGVVEAVGKDVTRFAPGDEVYGESASTHAEYVCVAADRVSLKPRNLTFEQAAAVPVAAMTALQGLRDKARVQPGDKVLVNGASGGVGTFVVQIAKAMGAEVTAVCSTRNVDLVRSIGADHAVDYTQGDFTETEERYDVIFDLVGSASLSACRRILSPKGVYIASVGRMGWALKAALASLRPGGKVAVLASQASPEDLAVLTGFIEAGEVTPVIDQRYTLSQVSAAMAYQGEGHTQGKSVISV